MQQIPSQQEIERFLAVKPYSMDYGFGCGKGAGYKDGTGFGVDESKENRPDRSNGSCGEGAGKGWNNGYEDGRGFGCGEGVNIDISFINGYPIRFINNLCTLIYQIRGNYAKGAITDDELNITPCFIARVDNCFAHGSTLHEADRIAQAKALENSSFEERIQRFIEKYPDPDKPVPFADLFNWRNILTDTYRRGHKQFVKRHNLDADAKYTPRFFIELTQKAYSKKEISALTKAYGISF